MEGLSNKNNYGAQQSLASNVELTLFGIDKKWVRVNKSWTDKSKVPVVQSKSFEHSIEEEKTTSHWWQFWKA